jgi:hypothetical protein
LFLTANDLGTSPTSRQHHPRCRHPMNRRRQYRSHRRPYPG